MTFRVSVICCLWLFTGAVVAHPGHDHSPQAGKWPVHAPDDRTAGLGAVGAAVAGLESAPLDSPSVQATIQSIGPGANHRLISWMFANGATGTSPNGGIDSVVSQVLANVNTAAFNDNFVYIQTSGIPSHSVGPFQNPNVPGDLNATYRVRLEPAEQLGTKSTSFDKLGTIGVMVNGTGIYSPSDGTYWNSSTNNLTAPGSGAPPNGTDWSTNALWRRAAGMDAAGGHPSPVRNQTNPDGSSKGLYHYHKFPEGLANELDPGNAGTMGSPIYGYAFDGFPIVGPYAYDDDGNGVLNAVQMNSSFKVGNSSLRGANGPSVSDYAMGSFLEDFEYQPGSGNLNEYNMAFVTFDDDHRAILADPLDTDGEWAYFLTEDVIAGSSNDTSLDEGVAYPYIIGPDFFGEVDSALVGGGMSNLNVPNNVTYLIEFLPGDYNTNGIVDAADFTVWRDAMGQPAGTLYNDVDGGVIGTDQYNTWQSNFGNVATLAAAAVPEPQTMTLFAGCFAILVTRRRLARKGNPKRAF